MPALPSVTLDRALRLLRRESTLPEIGLDDSLIERWLASDVTVDRLDEPLADEVRARFVDAPIRYSHVILEEKQDLTLTDPASFAIEHGRLSSGDVSLNKLVGPDVRALSGDDLWRWFLEGRSAVIDALRQLDPKERIAWIGPELGARSMATGRLMETWTHSHDLADTFGVDYPQTDRLRNIAHLGVVTREFSYVNRGLTATAYEFCKVLSRRQPLAHSTVHAEGPLAIEWMEIAQPWIEPPRISDRA